jgi:hypothetical protein
MRKYCAVGWQVDVEVVVQVVVKGKVQIEENP